MAPVSSLHAQSLLHPHFSHSTALSPHQTVSSGLKKTHSQIIVCSSKSNQQNENLRFTIENRTQIQRRDVLLHSVFGALSIPAILPLASAGEEVPDDFRIYSDDVNKFKIMIPRDWQRGEGEGNGIKSVTAFYPEEASNSNVSIVITGLGADFTKLESFGKVDEFAENLVSGLDRSWQRPPGVTAKLIDSKSSKGLYYIEYTLKNPGESQRHLFSVLGIANNGWYNRLYTLTGQYVIGPQSEFHIDDVLTQFIEEEAEKYGSKIQTAVASFRLT